MLLRIPYCILLFLILLLMSGYTKGTREIRNQEHFHKNVTDVAKVKSLQLYYKILDEISKRPAAWHGLPGKKVKFDNFVFDFFEASYIGLFTPNSIHVGKVMPIYFPVDDHSPYISFSISKEIVDSDTTYSLSDLSKIFKPLSGLQDSSLKLQTDADQCKIQPDEAETKICVRNIESIDEFIRHVFESEGNFKILETKQAEMYAGLLHEYTVLEYPQEIQGIKKVFCHPMSHAFYCHYSVAAKVLKVSLSTENGDKMEAIGVCHMLSPGQKIDDIFYRWLKIKPGTTAPVCHLLPAGHFVWVQSPNLDKTS